MGVDINWGLLQTPDIGQSLQAGYQQGRQLRQQQATENALAAFDPANPASALALVHAGNPQLGFAALGATQQFAQAQREQEVRQARQAVFAGGGQSGTTTEAGGLQINTAALQRYAADDPEGAQQIASWAQKATETQRKQAIDQADTVASLAPVLKGIPAEQRRAVALSYLPMLSPHGITSDYINGADLSDQSLDFMTAQSLGVKGVLEQNRKDADLAGDQRIAEARLANDTARTRASVANMGSEMVARQHADVRGAASDRREQVRFNERPATPGHGVAPAPVHARVINGRTFVQTATGWAEQH
jgi:hypothetical protein